MRATLLAGICDVVREGGACRAMDGVARSRCQIRVLGRSAGGRAAQVGCGVIVGPTLAITCTHVVIEALGLGDAVDPVLERREVRVRIPDDEPSEVSMRVVRAWPVDRDHPDLDGIERFHDICLLELYDSAFPASEGSRVATLCDTLPESGAILVGSGTSVEHVDVMLSCELGDPVSTRYMLSSPQSDKAIRDGCSGAGLFVTGVGLAGLVAEAQGRMGGFMIPARALRDAITRETRTSPAAPAAPATMPGPAGAKPIDVHSELFRKLDQLDRQPQALEFVDLLELSQRRRAGIVCTLFGLDTDQPYRCRDRLARNALRHSGCAPDVDDRVLPFELPLLFELKPDEAFRRLKSALKRGLEAASTEAPDLVAKLEERAVPLIAYSRIDEASLKRRSNRELIRRWAEFIDEVTRGKVPLKFVHFLVISLGAADDASDEKALEKRYEAAVRQLSADYPEGDEAPIRHIDRLKRLVSDDIQLWVRETGMALPLDRDLITSIQMRAEAKFPDDSRPRFAEVAAWIRQLNVKAEEA